MEAGTDENQNLLDKLKEATEIKTAGETQQAAPPKSTSFWGADDFEEEKPAPVQQPAETPAPVKQEPATQPIETKQPVPVEAVKDKPLTREARAAQARITTSAIDTVQTLLFTFGVNYKFKKKFTEAEQAKLDRISDAVPTALTDIEDKNLWLKWDKLMKKRDKKIRQIEMDETEQKDMTQMFMDYQEATGKLLSPGWGLCIALSDIMIKRAITVFMED